MRALALRVAVTGLIYDTVVHHSLCLYFHLISIQDRTTVLEFFLLFHFHYLTSEPDTSCHSQNVKYCHFAGSKELRGFGLLGCNRHVNV